VNRLTPFGLSYVARRLTEGKTMGEIARILKRYVAPRSVQTPPTTQPERPGRDLARSNRLTPRWGCATNDLPTLTLDDITGPGDPGVTSNERAPTRRDWVAYPCRAPPDVHPEDPPSLRRLASTRPDHQTAETA
jgi:hypothetical protein